MKNLLVVAPVLCWFLVMSTMVNAQITLKPKKAPEEMEGLNFIIGTWTNTTEFYDAAGKVTQKISSDALNGSLTIQPMFNGLALEGGADSQFFRSWYYYNELEGLYYHAVIDAMGNYNVFTGKIEQDKLIMTEMVPKKRENGGTIMWRRTYHDIEETSYSITMEYSTDEAKTWILSNKQLHIRKG